MNYSVEQLIRALTDNTFDELEGDTEVPADEELYFDTKWTSIIGTVIEEMQHFFKNGEVYPYGYNADEAILFLRPILEPYNAYPAIKNLVVTLEDVLVSRNIDPRPYVVLLKRAMDNPQVEKFYKERRCK